MEEIRLLSLVIPAFKQERTIVNDINNLDKVLSSLPYHYEIIVVIDGKLDNTCKKIKALRNPKVKVHEYEKNHGKGYAVRFGMAKTKGDIVGFIDAGMDIDPAGILMLLNHMEWYDADIIVGSKLHPVSQVYYPLTRKILSWGYRTFTHLLFGFKIRDTQVGLKFFKRKVVENVFPRLLVKQFAFDIEILAVAYSLGYKRIFEAPIKLDFNSKSSITNSSFWKIIFLMLWDTAAVFYRLRIMRYYSRIKIENNSENES